MDDIHQVTTKRVQILFWKRPEYGQLHLESHDITHREYDGIHIDKIGDMYTGRCPCERFTRYTRYNGDSLFDEDNLDETDKRVEWVIQYERTDHTPIGKRNATNWVDDLVERMGIIVYVCVYCVAHDFTSGDFALISFICSDIPKHVRLLIDRMDPSGSLREELQRQRDVNHITFETAIIDSIISKFSADEYARLEQRVARTEDVLAWRRKLVLASDTGRREYERVFGD